MNPYLSFALAMCGIVIVSLFVTAYLAVHFNRRAKADLEAALTPLGELLGGEIDVEEGKATGRFSGHIAEGRAANAVDGPGRVFLTSLVDGAGGEAWLATYRRPKDAAEPVETGWSGPDGPVGEPLRAFAEQELAGLIQQPGWARLGYDPGSGRITLTRPMAARRDLPSAEAFQSWLELLHRTAGQNRALQNPGS